MHPTVSHTLLLPYSNHDFFEPRVMRGPPLRWPVSVVEHPLGLVAGRLSWKTAQRLAATSSGVRRVVHEAFRMRFQHVLRNWAEPVDVFMRLMEETGAVFVGDVVVSFLVRDPVPWFGSTLQIVCPNDMTAFRRLRNFFRNRCGYNHWIIQPKPSDLHEVKDMYYTTRHGPRSPFQYNTQRVQIIVSSTFSPTSPIPRLWNTAYISYISSTEIVSAYPLSTFQRYAYLPLSIHDAVSPTMKYKLANQDFILRNYRTHTSSGDEIIMHPGYGASDVRSFNDAHSFRMHICLGRQPAIAGVLDPRPIHREENAHVRWRYCKSHPLCL